MLSYYLGQGYAVVEIAWNSAWEQTSQANIQNAACRPATFLNYVYTNIYQSTIQPNNSKAGMCAQGFSAGSAAIAYSMAYYGAANYLDNVELISGPVLSNIEQGCQEPQASTVQVCPPGQLGCPQGQASWILSPTYAPNDANYVKAWTNDNTCASPTVTPSSTTSEAAWLSESIVDSSTGLANQGAIPTFNYSTTGMGAWLCRSLLNSNMCTNQQTQYCPNNSSPQGQLFYANFTQSNSPASLNIYPVDGCNGPEGAPLGNVSALPNDPTGEMAIEQHMAGGGTIFPTGLCSHPQ
jgi:hypothetical protein